MRVWSCIVVSITSSEASQRDAVYFGYLTRIQINFCSGHDMKGVVRIIGWYSLYHGYPPQVRMDFSSIHDVKAPRGEWQARRGIWFLVLFSRCLVVILPCICKYKLPFFSFPSFPCHYFRDQSLSYPYSSFSSSCSCSRSCSHSSSSFILVRISVHVPPIPIFFLSFFLPFFFHFKILPFTESKIFVTFSILKPEHKARDSRDYAFHDDSFLRSERIRENVSKERNEIFETMR